MKVDNYRIIILYSMETVPIFSCVYCIVNLGQIRGSAWACHHSTSFSTTNLFVSVIRFTKGVGLEIMRKFYGSETCLCLQIAIPTPDNKHRQIGVFVRVTKIRLSNAIFSETFYNRRNCIFLLSCAVSVLRRP